MKNITNSESIRNINGGADPVTAVLGAIGLIGGAAAACKGAWDLGQWLAKKITGR